jgi:transposase
MHQADAYRRIELITGTVRRRRWTNDEKATIVAESTRPRVNIAEVARRFAASRIPLILDNAPDRRRSKRRQIF